MSNPTSKKTSRKLRLSLQTVHSISSGLTACAPTATCNSCGTSDCLPLTTGYYARDRH